MYPSFINAFRPIQATLHGGASDDDGYRGGSDDQSGGPRVLQYKTARRVHSTSSSSSSWGQVKERDDR